MKTRKKGRFGEFGGQYAPETLMNALNELEQAYVGAKRDKKFHNELAVYLREYAGRPSLLYFAERMTKDLGGAKIYLKREDLNHTGSHKINNVLGQVLLAKKMGKKRVIAETGAGQHGVATATAAALFNIECEIFMGKEDMKRQELNVFRMKLLGSSIRCVTNGTQTLKDATSEAMREWTLRVLDTFYVLGSVVGPHPYPTMVRNFQKIIGEEVKTQIMEKEGKYPDCIIACVGGGSNAMGIFYPFINDTKVDLIGVEAAGYGINTDKHCATLTLGEPGIFQGMNTYLLQDSNGQVSEVHSISAGLDYPGVGPEHSLLKDIKRVKYFSATDDEALKGINLLTKLEGILPALESAHAIAHLEKLLPETGNDEIVIVNVSGRGDKDLATIINSEILVSPSGVED